MVLLGGGAFWYERGPSVGLSPNSGRIRAMVPARACDDLEPFSPVAGPSRTRHVLALASVQGVDFRVRLGTVSDLRWRNRARL